MTYDQFIKQTANYLSSFVWQTQRTLFDVWKEDTDKAILLLRSKDEKLKYLDNKVAEDRKWFDEHSEQIDLVSNDVPQIFIPKLKEMIEGNKKAHQKLVELFSAKNNIKLDFKFQPSGDLKLHNNSAAQPVNIETLFVTLFEDYTDDFGLTIGIKLDFSFVMKIILFLSRMNEMKFVIEKIQEVNLQNNLGYVLKDAEIHLPPGFKLTDKEVSLKSERLNPQEVAILFHLLRKKRVLLDYSAEPFAHITYHLTGHSEQNLRTKGFGVVERLLKPDDYTKKENYMYNVRDLLEEVLKELDSYIERAEKKWSE